MLDHAAFTAAAVSQPGEYLDSRSLGEHRILITGAQTGGTVSVWEEIVEPGWGPPLHIHNREDEVFHVLEGRLRFWCGEEMFEAGAGATVALPRCVPHRFENIGETTARVLIVCTPGGFEGFFGDLDATPGFGSDAIGAIALRYGIEFVRD